MPGLSMSGNWKQFEETPRSALVTLIILARHTTFFK
jgi:hypothetical protein